MEYLDFHSKLDSMHNKDYIENFLVYNSSLVIAGVKPGVTVTINKYNAKLYESWNDYGVKFISNINLKFISLRDNSTSLIILIYDELLLKNELFSNAHRNFLINLGYPDTRYIDDYIYTLKSRYELYNCPHELGLFLGIPFEDVKDFIDCTTKKCLLCKYWKVYNDTEKAKLIFNKYDTVKEFTIKNILAGNSSRDLALSIKNSFNTEIHYI